MSLLATWRLCEFEKRRRGAEQLRMLGMQSTGEQTKNAQIQELVK